MALYHLLSGKKKMCLLQQWFNYSFCNRGHGCRKVLFASSIHRKEVWVFQFMIFILTGIFHPFSLPACIMHELSLVSVLLCMSWIVLGHIFGLTSADAETNIDVVMAKPDWIWFYSFSVDFDMDKEKFLVWMLHVFNIGVASSPAVGGFSAVREFKRKKKKKKGE